MNLVLASGSPRRKELLQNLGIKFNVCTPHTDENIVCNSPAELVESLAEKKAKAAQKISSADDLTLAADTVVVLDGKVLGKPHSSKEAAEMLSTLSGRTHLVYTGICIARGDRHISAHEVTEIEFSEIPEREIKKYIDSGEPFDKAGGYAIQSGLSSMWVKHIKGCYYNVVGFPINLINRVMQENFGIGLSDFSE